MSPEHSNYLVSQIAPLLDLAKNHYYQLVLITGGTWRERTLLLREIATQNNYAYIALGLPLSRSLLDQPLRDRPMALADHVYTLLASRPEAGIALDHIEVLFDPALHTDPLRLLQTHARSRLILACWPGQYGHNRLTYADPGNPEYYSQTVNGLLTYSLEVDG
jgi:hypothetical protein